MCYVPYVQVFQRVGNKLEQKLSCTLSSNQAFSWNAFLPKNDPASLLVSDRSSAFVVVQIRAIVKGHLLAAIGGEGGSHGYMAHQPVLWAFSSFFFNHKISPQFTSVL